MTRRTRTAALLSTATLLAGAAFSLALAPSAAADIPTPPLGTLVADPSSPTAGDTVNISGSGCFALALPVTKTAADASAAADPAASPSTDPDPDPVAGQVEITITGPNQFSSSDTATASLDGSWNTDQGIQIDAEGTYTVNASCTLTDPLPGGQQATFDYDPITLQVAAPPVVADPNVICSGCDKANPGDTVSVGGTDFPKDSVATITLAGYGSKTARVDDSGGFDPVSFVIGAQQKAATLDGSVAAGGVSVAYTVSVVLPTDGGGDVDGPVTGSGSGGSGSGGAGSGDVPVVTSSPNGVDVSSSAPQLPNTGADSLWPGVIGGLLVLSGTGLLWISRRRDDADVPA